MLLEENNKKERELCIRYGSIASEAMFDHPCQFFQIPECIGIIPYRIEYKCAIVFGEPICPPNETVKLTEAFHRYCKASNINVIYISVSEKFAEWANRSLCPIVFEVCEQFIFDPEFAFSSISRRLRHRVKKARTHGLTIHEYIPVNPEIENAIKQIGENWEKSIRGPHIYIGRLNFFESYIGKRWFYIKDGERITSMMMLSRIESCNGWLLKFLITSPDAFQNTSKFLMISVLEILKKENCRFLTKGMMPIDCLRNIKGLNGSSVWVAKNIYKAISLIFRFKKRNEYWLEYTPKAEPSYLLLSRSDIGINEIRALAKAFKVSYS